MHQPVPPGQSPPFAVIDPDHRGGLVVIVGALGLVISFVCLLIRLYVRLVLCPPFACDDFFLLTATVSDQPPDLISSLRLIVFRLRQSPSQVLFLEPCHGDLELHSICWVGVISM